MRAMARGSYWRRVVREYERSGKTQRGFAKSRGVNASSLRYWLTKLRREGAVAESVRMVPVEITPESAAAPVFEVVVPNGVALHFRMGTDLRYVAALLAELVPPAC